MSYQQLKEKSTLAVKTAVRAFIGNTLCYLPYIGLISKPSRKNGISVMIRTRNEEEWIELSLLSIKDFADEIVVVDASTDKTPEITRDVASKYDLNLKLIGLQTESNYGETKEYTNHSNIALKNTSLRWVLRWDGDYIAKSSIINLKKEILGLNPNIYYAFSLPVVNLEGDIFHQMQGRRLNKLNIESRLHTYSDALKYEDMGMYEVLHIPFYYKRSYKYVLKRQYHIFHMDSVKSAKRLLFRRFWTDWRELKDYNRFPILDDYVAYRIKKDWNIEDIEEAARYHLNEILCKSLVPYDKNQFGEYPELLKKELVNPRYKVIYKDGEIIGRNDTLR